MNTELRARTAMHRTELSRPLALAVAGGLVEPGSDIFDYGCGRGSDVRRLRELGVNADGWDPFHAPAVPKRPADVVNLGFVVNVIEDPAERVTVLRDAWALTRRALLVSARLDWDISLAQAVPHSDGLITTKGTFQKFYEHDELRAWLQAELGVSPDAAAPGIFFLFRSETDREHFLARAVSARHVGTRAPARLDLEENRELLQPLLDFLLERGRPPGPGEISTVDLITERFGSVGRAIRLLGRVADSTAWEAAATRRQRDLLVYLSLGTLRRHPKFSSLPADLQADIRAFFGSYSAATKLGRELLFAAGDQRAIADECAASPIGKLTPEALYVHVSAIQYLSVLLRVYEGCGRALYGDVPGATIVKLRRDKPVVSFLCYPDFDEDPHPRLKETFVAELPRLKTHHKTYIDRANPPVLHRKECLVSPEYPLHAQFAALTRAEEEAGLLDDAATIGTAEGWAVRLVSRGYVVRGHELHRRADSENRDTSRQDDHQPQDSEWLGTPLAKRALGLSDCALAHRRDAGELTWRKNGRRYEYLVPYSGNAGRKPE